MSRIAYVNGHYVPHQQAMVHIDDRGYQFGDGVYEVVLVVNGHLTDCDGHLKRLGNSLKYMKINPPISEVALRMVIMRIIKKNLVKYGIIYMQVTRGVARRDHKFPAANTKPALILTAKHLKIAIDGQKNGVAAICVPDKRWARRDIKTIQLLPNCLAKQAAAEQGAYEAIMIMPDNTISEGSSSNLWIVTDQGELVTRAANHDILNGITRQSIQRLAAQRQLTVVERAITQAEMFAAREVFLTSATSIVTGVTTIDGMKIADGELGELAIALRSDYIDRASVGLM